MAHKKKICTVALEQPIEACYEAYTYAPLVIEQRRKIGLEPAGPRGLKNSLAEELAAKVDPKVDKAIKTIPQVETMTRELISSNRDMIEELEKHVPHFRSTLETAMRPVLEDSVLKAKEKVAEKIYRDVSGCDSTGKVVFDPEHIINARSEKIFEDFNIEDAMAQEFRPFPIWHKYELPELGVFFSEEVCLVSEGFTYPACGKEFTLLPNDTIKESWSSEAIETDDSVSSETTSSDSTTTIKNDTTLTLTQTIENKIDKTTDIKLSRSLNLGVKTKLFKVLNVDIGSKNSGSFDFKRFVSSSNKSTSEDKRTFMRSVVQTLKSSTSLTRTRKLTTTEKASFSRSLTNSGETPLHYVEREQHCVYSVFHKRTNAQLAWSGCIDNPGRNLCRPQDFESNHAEEIAAIRQKWASKPAPASLGARPENRRMCTETFTSSKSGELWNGGVDFENTFQISIPAGYAYIGASADIEILHHSTDIASQLVMSQPGGGITGTGNISVHIRVANRRFHREQLSYRVCYDVASLEAIEWDRQLEIWRTDQANSEISTLREAKELEYSAFLESDLAREALSQEIFEKYFGIDNIQDCCRFIARLERIFDFEKLSYRLLPSWNAQGQGCEKSEPVNLYNALCAHFYLPFHPGRELEGYQILAAINAVPQHGSIPAQIAGYINEINAMRETLFNRVFDPSDGWAEKLDKPNGYCLTPYDTDNTDHEADFESLLNYQLIDAHTITVPAGKRVEMRPDLC